MRQRRADGAHVREDVDLEGAQPVVVRQLVERRLPRRADVVDQDVEAAEALDTGGDRLRGPGRDAQVDLAAEHVGRTLRPQRLDRAGQAHGVPAGDGDRRTGAGRGPARPRARCRRCRR